MNSEGRKIEESAGAAEPWTAEKDPQTHCVQMLHGWGHLFVYSTKHLKAMLRYIEIQISKYLERLQFLVNADCGRCNWMDWLQDLHLLISIYKETAYVHCEYTV